MATDKVHDKLRNLIINEVSLIDWFMVEKHRSGCFYCTGHFIDCGTLTMDHIMPRRYNRHSAFNKIPEINAYQAMNKIKCCHACNRDKADLFPSQWLWKLLHTEIHNDRHYNVMVKLQKLLDYDHWVFSVHGNPKDILAIADNTN